MDFLTIEITSKEVRGNNVDFSISEIKSKKYMKMTWKFVEIWSSTYRSNIHVSKVNKKLSAILRYEAHWF